MFVYVLIKIWFFLNLSIGEICVANFWPPLTVIHLLGNYKFLFLNQSLTWYPSRGWLAQSGERPLTNSAIGVRLSRWVILSHCGRKMRNFDLFEIFSDEPKNYWMNSWSQFSRPSKREWSRNKLVLWHHILRRWMHDVI